jgi:hypothetical protein
MRTKKEIRDSAAAVRDMLNKGRPTKYWAWRVHLPEDCAERVERDEPVDVVDSVGVDLGVFDDHAAAHAAIIADIGGKEVCWTRPNWTAVDTAAPVSWNIQPYYVTAEGEKVFAEDEYGPLEYEMDAKTMKQILINVTTGEQEEINLKPKNGITDAEVEAFLAERVEEGKRIDLKNCECATWSTEALDPYGVFEVPKEYSCIGSEQFVRNLPDGNWVWFGDVPEEIFEAAARG